MLNRWRPRWLWGLLSWNSERDDWFDSAVCHEPGVHRDEGLVRRDFIGLRLTMNKQQTGE